MRVYHFSEHPYPPAWQDPKAYLRVNLPNRRSIHAARLISFTAITTNTCSRMSLVSI